MAGALCVELGVAQVGASPASRSESGTQTPAISNQASQQTPKPSPPDEKEIKITPHEAEVLFHSVDEILEFDSKETGLAVKHSVKRRLTSRDEVLKFLTEHMKEEDTRRLQRSEMVLKKFGLLPRDFDLEKLLLSMLEEQIAGYYDPKTKTVNLLDWIPSLEQEPVLAHELTHALQDQAIGLAKFMKKGDRDLAESKKEPKAEDIENDEMDDARQAIVEGQAEAVMLDYALKPVGRSLADSPEVVSAMESEMENGTADSAVFKSAPLFLRESLAFPYNYGLKFEIRMMEAGGRQKAFASVLANPPHTSRQIMQPETYLSGERLSPMHMVDFANDFKDYDRFDVGAIGENDTATMIEQYAGKQISERLYRDWRGAYYYAVHPKGQPGSPLGVLYLSRWSSAEKAGEFASVYAKAIAGRYKSVREIKAQQAVAQSGPQAQSTEPAYTVDVLKGRHEWTTEEGPVVVDAESDTVLVMESLDAATARSIERELFGSANPAAGPQN